MSGSKVPAFRWTSASRSKYVLSDDIEAFMRGEGWHGVTLDDVEDMHSWPANHEPTYE